MLRPLVVAALAAGVLAVGASDGRAADCTAAAHARGQAALASYRKGMASARRAYFAKHRSARQRAAFVSAQEKRLGRLKAIAGCTVGSSGSGGGETLPSPLPAPPPAANEHFSYSDGVPADLRTEVEGDIAWAVADEQSFLGAQIGDVTVFVSTDPVWLAQHDCDFYGHGGDCVAQKTAQFAGGGGAEGGFGALFLEWETAAGRPSASELQKTLAHELFHTFQYETDGLVEDGETPLDQVRAAGPAWLGEGSAEVVGYRALGDRHLGYSTYPNLLLTETSKAKPVTAPLDQLLTVVQDRAAGSPYPLYMVAVDHLLTLAPDGPKALVDYYRRLGAGSPWPDAFAAAFGLSVDAFYADFAAYRSRL